MCWEKTTAKDTRIILCAYELNYNVVSMELNLVWLKGKWKRVTHVQQSINSQQQHNWRGILIFICIWSGSHNFTIFFFFTLRCPWKTTEFLTWSPALEDDSTLVKTTRFEPRLKLVKGFNRGRPKLILQYT